MTKIVVLLSKKSIEEGGGNSRVGIRYKRAVRIDLRGCFQEFLRLRELVVWEVWLSVWQFVEIVHPYATVVDTACCFVASWCVDILQRLCVGILRWQCVTRRGISQIYKRWLFSASPSHAWMQGVRRILVGRGILLPIRLASWCIQVTHLPVPLRCNKNRGLPVRAHWRRNIIRSCDVCRWLWKQSYIRKWPRVFTVLFPSRVSTLECDVLRWIQLKHLWRLWRFFDIIWDKRQRGWSWVNVRSRWLAKIFLAKSLNKPLRIRSSCYTGSRRIGGCGHFSWRIVEDAFLRLWLDLGNALTWANRIHRCECRRSLCCAKVTTFNYRHRTWPWHLSYNRSSCCNRFTRRHSHYIRRWRNHRIRFHWRSGRSCGEVISTKILSTFKRYIEGTVTR